MFKNNLKDHDMDTPPQTGFVLEVWHAVTTALAGLLIWAWKFVTGNIKELKDNSVTKADFEKYSDHAQTQRDELREAIIKLFDGQSTLTAQMNDQHVKILNAIHEIKK